MTATIYLLFFTTFSVMLELILRSFGLYLPLAALFLFYAAIVFGYRAGAAAALLAACGLDFMSGNPHPYTLPAFGLVIALSWFWLNKVESESIFLHVIPGALIPLPAWFCTLLFFAACQLGPTDARKKQSVPHPTGRGLRAPGITTTAND